MATVIRSVVACPACGRELTLERGALPAVPGKSQDLYRCGRPSCSRRYTSEQLQTFYMTKSRTQGRAVPDPKAELIVRLEEILENEGYSMVDTVKLESDIKALAMTCLTILKTEEDQVFGEEKHVWLGLTCIRCGCARPIVGTPQTSCLGVRW